MTTNTELIADLQSNIVGDPFPLMRKAADAIEVLQAEVERLKAFAGGYANENLRLQAQLAAAPSVPEGWKQAVALAYGHLWHVNNEPMAPIPLRSSETAAYEARKQLRDLLTHEERGLAINQVQALLAAAPQPKEPK